MQRDDSSPPPDCAPYSHEDLHADLQRALFRFFGTVNPLGAREDHCGPNQIIARRALARILRAAFDHQGSWQELLVIATYLGGGLAKLLDPDNTEEPYELVLRRRKRQKGPLPLDEGTVVAYLRWRLGHSDRAPRGRMKAAIADAMEMFGLSRGTVYHIWQRRRPIEPHVQPRVPERYWSLPLPPDPSKVETLF
jgi:hypothetical protein